MAERLNGGPRGKRTGIRKLLFDEHRKTCNTNLKSRWYIAGVDCDYCAALADGSDVAIGSVAVFKAMFNAGMNADAFAFGGELFQSEFRLTGDELVPYDPAELDPEPDSHCKGGRTCMRCDPDNTGQQTIDVPRARQSWDWYFIEWPSDDDQLNKEAQHA